MAAISQTTLSIAFSWMKMLEVWLNFHWNSLLRVQLTIFQHWFRKWLGADEATSHYPNQWWLDYRRIYAALGLSELNCRHWDKFIHNYPLIISLRCLSATNQSSLDMWVCQNSLHANREETMPLSPQMPRFKRYCKRMIIVILALEL